MPIRAYYSSSIEKFQAEDPERILGILTLEHNHALKETQRQAWLEQITILKSALARCADGYLLLELHIPRVGKRADAALVLAGRLFVIEFKIGAIEHSASAIDQVVDYSLDLKNFHEGSHTVEIVPILVSTRAKSQAVRPIQFSEDLVAAPVLTNATDLAGLIERLAEETSSRLDFESWRSKGYKPTPTIIEAAQALYQNHDVKEISRSDAGAKNLAQTSASVHGIAEYSQRAQRKAICFVTGVPGSGKTLAGLNIATGNSTFQGERRAAFLSGNGPLVDVLREALARDKKQREGGSKARADREVRSFIQNVHHFRDHYLRTPEVPFEKIVVFDEAQRAWTRKQTSNFMRKKRGLTDFDQSEPEFLIGVMDRHPDWCAIVCLVGGGQEINTGEAGISEWINAIGAKFPHWDVYVSTRITSAEYGLQEEHSAFFQSPRVTADEELHLGVSMRSFRAEALSEFVGRIVEGDPEAARSLYEQIHATYPVFLTRSLDAARSWLRSKARGSERNGLVASSGALRLKPDGIHIKADLEPPNWFLNGRRDVRSSCFLEDAGTEFAVQGLELDWAGVCWDADLYYSEAGWQSQAFKGTKWQSVRNASRKLYLKNAYRVLLTRARQGMVIYVPEGSDLDHTRPPHLYQQTFDFLRSCGIPALEMS